MRHAVLIAAICLSVWSHEALAETAVPNITGMPYNTARGLLMSAGWQPATTIAPNTPLMGTAEEFRNIGFSEINDCEGSGVAACMFYFRDVNSKILKVVTVNESEPSKGSFPNVDSYSFERSLPESDDQDSQPSAPVVKASTTTPTTQPNATPTRAETLLGLSLLECGAATSVVSDNLSAAQKGSGEALNSFSKTVVEEAKKYLGVTYVGTFYQVYLDNAKDELKAAYANGPSDGEKYSNIKMQSCLDIYTKTKLR